LSEITHRDREHRLLIIELAGGIDRRLSEMEWSAFETDRDEIDLTAFRLLHIGESSNKLSQGVKDRHPDIPWQDYRILRNFMSHEYLGFDVELTWKTAKEMLAPHVSICTAELDRNP
jgi:uncharacterized protein with HEPN domain